MRTTGGGAVWDRLTAVSYPAARRAVILLLASVGIGLCGCGSSTSTASSTSAPATSSASTASTASTAPAPTGTAQGAVNAHIAVSGALTLSLTASRVQCTKDVGADGSSGVTVVIRVTDGTHQWQLLVGASGPNATYFDQPQTFATDAANGMAIVNFLDTSNATGANWTVGNPHAVRLPGTVVVQAGKSGTVDAALGGADLSTTSQVHVKADWTCNA
jgi:hypothetical protein